MRGRTCNLSRVEVAFSLFRQPQGHKFAQMDVVVVANSTDGGDGDDHAVLRFALATFAMKRGALCRRTAVASSPPLGASNSKIAALQTASSISPARVYEVTPNVISIHSAVDEEVTAGWTMDDLLSALHQCLQDLQTAREDAVGDREEEAARVSQLLHRFTIRPEPRECLLRTLVDAMAACEEGEEDSLLIECVSQGGMKMQRALSNGSVQADRFPMCHLAVMIALCFADLAHAQTESGVVVNGICEEACSALMESLAEMQEADFQFSAGGKTVAQTLAEIQTMLRVFYTEDNSPTPMLLTKSSSR